MRILIITTVVTLMVLAGIVGANADTLRCNDGIYSSDGKLLDLTPEIGKFQRKDGKEVLFSLHNCIVVLEEDTE